MEGKSSVVADVRFLLIFAVVLPTVLVMCAAAAARITQLQPIAVICATLGCFVTARHVAALHHVNARGSLWAINMMFLVPVLALLCWLTMVLADFTTFFDVFKAMYESFTFFSFLMLLASRCELRGTQDDEFLLVLQYILVNIIFACLAFFAPYPPVVECIFNIISFASCSLALLALARLHAVSTSSISNAHKFWSMKGMFSLLFNQRLLLERLPSSLFGAAVDPAELERSLICLELLPLAISNLWAYPIEEFKRQYFDDGTTENESSYGSARAEDPAHSQTSIPGTLMVDESFGVAFLGGFCSLVVAAYLWQAGTLRAQRAASLQVDRCHWYNWVWYFDSCSPEFYAVESWLRQSVAVTMYVRFCILLFFVSLLASTLGYILLKRKYLQLRPAAEAQVLFAARCILSFSLILAALAMALAASIAFLHPSAS